MLRVIIIAIALIGIEAHGADWNAEILVGGSHAKGQEGIWQQATYPSDIDHGSIAYQIGVSKVIHKLDNDSVGLRVAYVNFGHLHSSANFTIDGQEGQPAQSGRYCNPQTGIGCVWGGEFSQKASGISFGGFGEHSFGAIAVNAEIGALAYYARFDGDFHQINNSNVPLNNPAWGGWKLTAYGGVGAKYSLGSVDLLVNARYYNNVEPHQRACGGCSGYTKSAITVMAGAGYKF